MVQSIAALCRACGLSAKIEPSNSFRSIDGNDNKRPDLDIRGLEGMPILADVGVATATCKNLTYNSAKIIGRAASNYAQIKHAKYDTSTAAVGSTFVPIIFENRGY